MHHRFRFVVDEFIVQVLQTLDDATLVLVLSQATLGDASVVFLYGTMMIR